MRRLREGPKFRDVRADAGMILPREGHIRVNTTTFDSELGAIVEKYANTLLESAESGEESHSSRRIVQLR